MAQQVTLLSKPDNLSLTLGTTEIWERETDPTDLHTCIMAHTQMSAHTTTVKNPKLIP